MASQVSGHHHGAGTHPQHPLKRQGTEQEQGIHDPGREGTAQTSSFEDEGVMGGVGFMRVSTL